VFALFFRTSDFRIEQTRPLKGLTRKHLRRRLSKFTVSAHQVAPVDSLGGANVDAKTLNPCHSLSSVGLMSVRRREAVVGCCTNECY